MVGVVKLPSAENLFKSKCPHHPTGIESSCKQNECRECIRNYTNAVLEAAAEIADSHQDEPWGEYKNWRASQVASREIRDMIRELKGAE